ncbi:hypothetical protein BDZ89DRAFT_1035298 [Hymenopellis radicata]|nr:hypothetical protein BDZ89DRAFT_1035298 [Hymenopellis radicata]
MCPHVATLWYLSSAPFIGASVDITVLVRNANKANQLQGLGLAIKVVEGLPYFNVLATWTVSLTQRSTTAPMSMVLVACKKKFEQKVKQKSIIHLSGSTIIKDNARGHR